MEPILTPSKIFKVYQPSWCLCFGIRRAFSCTPMLEDVHIRMHYEHQLDVVLIALLLLHPKNTQIVTILAMGANVFV